MHGPYGLPIPYEIGSVRLICIAASIAALALRLSASRLHSSLIASVYALMFSMLLVMDFIVSPPPYRCEYSNRVFGPNGVGQLVRFDDRIWILCDVLFHSRAC